MSSISKSSNTKSLERNVFFLTTAVVIPATAVAIVVGYGFTVWVYQMMAGPPSF